MMSDECRMLFNTGHSSLNTCYQELFVTPGIKPRWAMPRKQMRQMPNTRMYPRGRPHNWQRFLWRAVMSVVAFWRTVLATLDFFAIVVFVF
jgi:hypothetical protein